MAKSRSSWTHGILTQKKEEKEEGGGRRGEVSNSKNRQINIYTIDGECFLKVTLDTKINRGKTDLEYIFFFHHFRSKHKRPIHVRKNI